MNYRERMAWLTAEIRSRISDVEITPSTKEPFSSEQLKLLEVTAGLLRAAIEQVEGLQALLAAQKFDSSFVVQRAIWEYWKEYEFIIARPTRSEDAVRFEANTLFDVLDTLQPIADSHPNAVAKVEEWLTNLEARFQSIVSDVKTRRGKKRGHWSGEQRSKVFAPTERQSTVYRALSWQSHPELAVFREIEVNPHDGGATLKIVPEVISHEVAERAAWAVSGMLWYFWVDFARLWRLNTFELPSAAASA